VRLYPTAEAFLRTATPNILGCLLVDVRMPGMTGLRFQDELRARRITTPLIILTAYPEWAGAVRAMKTGALDYIEKRPDNAHALLDAVQHALERSCETRQRESERGMAKARWRGLTARECQVTELMSHGKSNREAASQLGLSLKTVEFHVTNIMKKMDAASRSDVIRLHTLIAESPIVPPTDW
jgi:FixJ family two-component response regulator